MACPLSGPAAIGLFPGQDRLKQPDPPSQAATSLFRIAEQAGLEHCDGPRGGAVFPPRPLVGQGYGKIAGVIEQGRDQRTRLELGGEKGDHPLARRPVKEKPPHRSIQPPPGNRRNRTGKPAQAFAGRLDKGVVANETNEVHPVSGHNLYPAPDPLTQGGHEVPIPRDPIRDPQRPLESCGPGGDPLAQIEIDQNSPVLGGRGEEVEEQVGEGVVAVQEAPLLAKGTVTAGHGVDQAVLPAHDPERAGVRSRLPPEENGAGRLSELQGVIAPGVGRKATAQGLAVAGQGAVHTAGAGGFGQVVEKDLFQGIKLTHPILLDQAGPNRHGLEDQPTAVHPHRRIDVAHYRSIVLAHTAPDAAQF